MALAFTTFNSLTVLLSIIRSNNASCAIELTCGESLKGEVSKILSSNPYHQGFVSKIDHHGQLQTLVQTVWRSITSILLPLVYSRELLEFEDGGHVALDWITHSKPKPNADVNREKIVLIAHGLCGDSNSEYIVHLADILLCEGFSVVVMVGRGCGGLQLTSHKVFVPHRDDESDLKVALQYIQHSYPDASIFGLGFSLGAAAWLKEIGTIEKTGASTGLRAAVCVSPPWDMLRATKVFHLWSPILTAALKLYALTHRHIISRMGISLWKVLTAKTLDQFDANFIASYGYHSVEEYRQESSPIRVAKYIRTPTLAISSLDDPVCCASGCPEDREAYASGKDNSAKLESSGIESGSGSGTGSSERSAGPGLVIIKTPYGGHLGFPVPARPPVKGAGSIPWGAWLQTTWTDRVIVDWFHAMSTRA